MYICKNKIDIIIYTYLFRYDMYVWGSEELFVNTYEALDTAILSIGYFTFVRLSDVLSAVLTRDASSSPCDGAQRCTYK